MLFFGLGKDGMRIDHSLNLRRIPIQALPDRLHGRDDLDLRATGIATLPRGRELAATCYCPGA
jgi:hypothetical protein